MYAVRSRKIAIFFTLFALSAGAVSASPDPDCIPTLMSLGKCGAFVMAGSNATEPDNTCCDGLKAVLRSDDQSGTHNGVKCLCDAFNDRDGFGIQLNVTKAVSLADACYLTFPPVTNCSFGHALAPVPARSPLVVLVPPSSVVDNPNSGSFSLAASIELLVCTSVALAALFLIHQPDI